MEERSNAEWVTSLRASGPEQELALRELTAIETRAARFYLGRTHTNLADDQVEAIVDDSAQEATLLVLAKLDSFRGEARFTTWASTFGVRVTRTALKRHAWREVSLQRLPDRWQEKVWNRERTPAADSPEIAAEQNAAWDMVREIVEQDLTARQREVLNLVVLYGVATEGVERLLGVTPSALYKMTHDARKKLKAGLAKRGFGPAEIIQLFAAEG